MLDRGMDTRRGIRAIHSAQVNFWIDASDIVIIASYQRSFASKLYFFTIAENQFAPGSCRVKCWLAGWFCNDRFMRRYCL